VAEVADSLAWNLNTEVHEIIKGAVLEAAAETLGAIDELAPKKITHD